MMLNTLTVEDVETEIRAFEALQAVYSARRARLLACARRNAIEHAQLDDCILTLRQLEQGASTADGVNADMAALLARPSLQKLQLRVPGLAALRRLRDNLTAAPTPSPQGGRYRLKEGMRHSLPDRDLQPGEVIELTAKQAAAFGDKFEPVSEV